MRLTSNICHVGFFSLLSGLFFIMTIVAILIFTPLEKEHADEMTKRKFFFFYLIQLIKGGLTWSSVIKKKGEEEEREAESCFDIYVSCDIWARRICWILAEKSKFINEEGKTERSNCPVGIH